MDFSEWFTAFDGNRDVLMPYVDGGVPRRTDSL
jgi:hypothetical protein